MLKPITGLVDIFYKYFSLFDMMGID